MTPSPYVLRGQQLIQQIADATTLDDKRQLIAELERHLVRGVKKVDVDYKVAAAGKD